MTSWQAWKNRFFAALVAGVVSTQAVADPVVTLAPTLPPVVVGSGASVAVLINGVTDLYGYQFSLAFNPAVLQTTGVTEGSFLSNNGVNSTFFSGGTVNNTTGRISFVFDTLVGPDISASNSGVLAYIWFDAIAAGTSALTFSDTMLIDANLAVLPSTFVNNSITVTAVPEPASALMLAAGIAGFMVLRRRKAA